MTKRTLSLKRETLTELSGADLARVAGGAEQPTISCPIRYCLIDSYLICLPTEHCIPTENCPTLFC